MGLSDRLAIGVAGLWLVLRHPYLWARMRLINKLPTNPILPSSDIDRFAWRKLFDHDPMFTLTCDKLAAKHYALEVCPELKTAEVLWHSDSVDDIPLDLLKGDVMFKANHGSGWNIFIRDGKYDLDELRRKGRHWLTHQYGTAGGEWAYRDARKRILIERMLMENGEAISTEYKFHVSGGRTGYVYVKRGTRATGENWICLERDGTPLPEPKRPGTGWALLPISPSFIKMRDIAERLAAPLDHVRVDLYDIGGEIYFSELTIYPQSGRGVVNPRLSYLRVANWDLRKTWFLTQPQQGWRARYAAALRRWIDRQPPPAEPVA